MVATELSAFFGKISLGLNKVLSAFYKTIFPENPDGPMRVPCKRPPEFLKMNIFLRPSVQSTMVKPVFPKSIISFVTYKKTIDSSKTVLTRIQSMGKARARKYLHFKNSVERFLKTFYMQLIGTFYRFPAMNQIQVIQFTHNQYFIK